MLWNTSERHRPFWWIICRSEEPKRGSFLGDGQFLGLLVSSQTLKQLLLQMQGFQLVPLSNTEVMGALAAFLLLDLDVAAGVARNQIQAAQQNSTGIRLTFLTIVRPDTTTASFPVVRVSSGAFQRLVYGNTDVWGKAAGFAK